MNYYESNVEIYTKAEERDVQIFRFKSKTESHDFYNNTKNLNQIDLTTTFYQMKLIQTPLNNLLEKHLQKI